MAKMRNKLQSLSDEEYKTHLNAVKTRIAEKDKDL